ncbi:MAG: A/G-specific adenine glycosylase [Nevskiaceae bacterium]|nr:MAG: A/G-specific adenine glycosylase [Nevskiaceae bacterium]TBR71806.1 MAG: A/G-specific adenine glycosylase [Nevskiaceae bacterium]
MKPAVYAERLLVWYDRAGRHDLPWQKPRTPYRVWLAEIMLQQTQVATVIPYFQHFIARFPDVQALAAAAPDEVLAAWSGLGYYARARNLHAAARRIVGELGGNWPQTLDGWLALPGIGRSTAGAVLAQAFGQRHAILDGNVRRVLARHTGIAGWPGVPAVARELWTVAEQRLPHRRLADYTQAQMDLGALLCTARNPRCAECPVAADCVALRENHVAQLPTPRPRRERPRRVLELLLVGDGNGRWLLERRPPAGIWGGLWCPPLVETAQQRQAWCVARGITVSRWRRLAAVEHGFTHFQLEMRPRVACLTTAGRGARAADDAARWLTVDEVLALGLPAPVRRLFVAELEKA